MQPPKTVAYIILNAIPIALMIGFVPFIANDYLLTAIDAAIIITSFLISHKSKEYIVFLFGFIVMILAELFFTSTGVETFTRRTLFGTIPLWLPFLWAYAFVAIKRGVLVLAGTYE